MKHTKGPWSVGQTTGLKETILSPQGGMIAKVLTKGTLNNHYNAKLIAAAPDMLEALEQALRCLVVAEHNGAFADCAAPRVGEKLILKIDALIDKAKGEL